MYTVGLTGGICSGKTTISNLFKSHGVAIVDADVIAHQLTEKGSAHLEVITKYFGNNALLPNGAMNRQFIRQRIFTDPQAKKWLEQFLHPLIRSKMMEQIQNAQSAYCIAAIPLLAESAGADYINRVLVIDSSKALQIERTMSRDNIDRSDATAIIDQQASMHERFAIADDIIHNNGTLDALEPQVDKLHQQYIQQAKAH